MSHRDWENELSELIVRKLDGSLSDDEFKRLETLLSEDTATVEFYVKTIITNALLEDKSSIPIGEGGAHQGLALLRAEQPLDSDVSAQKRWEVDAQLHEIERHAKMEFERFREQERLRQEELAHKVYLMQRRRLLVGFSSLAAIVIIFLLSWLVPKSQEESVVIPKPLPLVASILKSVDAQWDSNDVSTAMGTRLAASTPLRLKQGLMQLSFDQGAEVILQAPSHIRLDDTGRMMLFQGVLSAVVPESAIGFVVETPTGIIKDYGTEFGVLTSSGGKTETQVYQGRVTLESKATASASRLPKELRANQAATVDPLGHIKDIVFRSQRFIREIDEEPGFGIPGKRLCVADIVAGGNGLGLGTYGAGLLPSDGMIIPTRIGGDARTGQGFIPVPDLEFIDGVFVPDGGAGRMIISTSGLSFEDGTDTTGKCHGGIISQAKFASTGDSFQSLHDGELLGVRYNTPQHPSIGMHANSGITIDLQKIRERMAGVEITTFHSLCGVSSTVLPSIEASDVKDEIQGVDFWVLVDGQPRFNRTVAPQKPESIEIDVSLQAKDRFLTLMTTTPGPITFCWGMLAEPYLELTSPSR